MKKILILPLSALMALSLLAGCSQKNAKEAGVPADKEIESKTGDTAADDAQPAIEWQVTYDGPDKDDDRMFGVAELAEGGYAACANSENSDESETGVMLKYSADGTQEWATTIENTHLQAVIETEAGLLAVGNTTSTGAPFFDGAETGADETKEEAASSEGTEEEKQPDINAAAVLFDMEGNILWAKSFGGTGYDIFTGHSWSGSGYPVVLPNGNFLIPGNSASEDGDFAEGHAGAMDGILAEIDKDGNLVSTNVFGGSGSDTLHEVKAAKDGGFYIAGTAHPAVDEKTEQHFPYDGMFEGMSEDWDEDSVFVSKLDKDRNIVWTKLIPSHGSWVVGLALADDDGAVVTADALEESVEGKATSLYIKKLDAEGNIIWENQYSNDKDDAAGMFVTSLDLMPDGNYLLSSEVHYESIIDEGSEGMRGWLGCIDPKGDLLWERNFEGTDYELHIHAAATADGGSILAAQQASEKGDWDAVLLKYAPYTK